MKEKKGAILTREQFKTMTMRDAFYAQRSWDLEMSKPEADKPRSLNLPA
ncbi:MAG: hypothetical protein PVH85_33530 [Desulfobacterales bacterium]|jgi:hypothetical protein